MVAQDGSEPSEHVLYQRSKRGRKLSPYESLKGRVDDKVEALREELASCKDKAQKKKLRNKISAYESRLNNRATIENL